mgnify:FL=1
MSTRSLIRVYAMMALLLTTLSAAADSVYLAPEDFITAAFAGDPPAAELLWISTPQRNELRNMLD